MKLWAISDLHVGHPDNRRRVEAIAAHPGDWLVLAGDLGETLEHCAFVFETLKRRFRRLIWVPGNHELWTLPGSGEPRGEDKYQALVDLCRRHGVDTPEDPYPLFEDGGRRWLIAPLFALYDYSFAPGEMTAEQALAWAREHDLECVDEHLLHPDPHPSKVAWCAARCDHTEQRLERAVAEHDAATVLVNHYPLVPELVSLPRIPRFRIWCGTWRTADWHLRFRAEVAIYGHLHIRRSTMIDGVRFEEVSLGYPQQWRRREAPPGLRHLLGT